MSSRLFQKGLVIWSLPRLEKAWLTVLLPMSGVARLALLIMPFRRVAGFLGKPHANIQLSPLAEAEQMKTAKRIGSLTKALAKYVPWESKCLVQAIMVKTLLRIHGIPYVLHLGVAKTKPSGDWRRSGGEKPLAAHAWVKVGKMVVSGRAGHEAYTVVSTFVSPALLRSYVEKEVATRNSVREFWMSIWGERFEFGGLYRM